MKARFFRKILPLLATIQIVLLTIFVSTLSAIPTTQCHCHDTKSSPKQQSECPFAQLRGLAQVLSIVPPIAFEFVQAVFELNFRAVEPQLVTLDAIRAFCSRAPPTLA